MFPLLLIIIAGLFAFLAWKNARLALVLLIAATPSYVIRFDVGPIPFTVLELMILILTIVWLLQRKRWKPFDVRHPVVKPMGVLLIAATIALFVSLDMRSALGIWKAYFIEPMIIFVLLWCINPPVRWIVRALTISALCIGAIGILQWISGVGIPIPWDYERRITSVYPFPNAVGLYLAPIVSFLAVWCLGTRASTQRSAKYHLLEWSAIIISITAIILAQSEAALVAMISVGLIIGLFLIVKKNVRWTQKLAVMSVLGLVVLFIVMIPSINQKLLLQDYSGEVRRSQWRETIQLLKDRPIFGAGLSGYQTALLPYHTDTHIEIFQYPHTILLNVWVEIGILGVLAFLFLDVVLLKHVWRVYRYPHTRDESFLVMNAALCALMVMGVHGVVDVAYFKNDLAILTWTLVYLLLTTRTPV